jgi:hypothetical protein
MTTTVLVGLSKFALAQASGGQVIAHSASVDLTQQELDNELRLANVQASQRTDQTIKAALTRIIARKYMARQALAAKLDSEPGGSRFAALRGGSSPGRTRNTVSAVKHGLSRLRSIN